MNSPTINYYPQKHRGTTSSLDFNSFSKAAMEDIASLYKLVAEQQSTIEEYYELLSLQQIYTQNHYNNLIARYNNLNNMLYSYSEDPPASTDVYLSYYNDNNISYGGFPSYGLLGASDRCTLDTQHGLLLPNMQSSQSRIYIYDDITQQTFIPESVDNYKISSLGECVIRIKNQDYNNCYMKPVLNAFDGQTETYWYVKAQYSNIATDSLEVMIDLPLPVGAISSLDCNYITVEPFPSFATQITGLYYTTDDKSIIIGDAMNFTNSSGITQYTGNNSTKWTEIKTNVTDLYQVNDTDTKVVFPTVPITGIRVCLKTSLYTIDSGLKTFILGVRNIDCGYSSFTSGKALTRLSIGSKSFMNVINPTKTNTVSNVDYNLYYDFGHGDIVSYRFDKNIPSGVKTIYVETILKEATSLYGLHLRYNVY